MQKSRVALVLAVCLGGLVCGCSGGGDFKVGKVKGQVTCQGQPVANAMVQLMPQQSGEGGVAGKSASGMTDASGNFTLSTYAAGDGAVIGTHAVQVASLEPDQKLPGVVPEGMTFEVKQGENELKIELVPGG